MACLNNMYFIGIFRHTKVKRAIHTERKRDIFSPMPLLAPLFVGAVMVGKSRGGENGGREGKNDDWGFHVVVIFGQVGNYQFYHCRGLN